MRMKLKNHWPEYLIEASLLGIFMLSACSFTALMEHPSSPLASVDISQGLRRTLIGIAMGMTAMALIYSPWGRRSGAHMNPSVTITFLMLGKVAWLDAVFYLIAQFVGAAAAISLVGLAFRQIVAHPTVDYIQTQPGAWGVLIAFAAELGISFVLMLTVLEVSNSPRISHLTGLCAGTLVAIYISLEAPISGMSMNPARSFASAFASGNWAALWIYLLAPPIGMLTAAGLYSRLSGSKSIRCAKMHHSKHDRCIFCDYHSAIESESM